MTRCSIAHATRSRTPLALLAVAGLGAVGAVAQSASAQRTIEWASPVDGDFAVAGNWLPMAVPGANDTALLGGVGPYLVTVWAPTPVGMVLLASPQASLLVRPGASLTVGELEGEGTLRLSDGTSTTPAELLVENRGTIDAEIFLGGTRLDRARIVGLGSSHTLGRNAVVTAPDGASGSITGPWTSEATILKEGPGVLSVSGLEIVGGRLRSSGGGQIVLSNATVTDATIEVGPDARFVTNQNTIVSDSTIVGQFMLRSGQDITFGRGVVLQDSLTINEPGSTGQARLFVEDGVALNGEILLEGSTSGGEIIGLGDVHFLGPDAVVTGERGAIVGPWISEADIFNDGPGGLSLSGLEVVGGTLRSSGGGRLDLAGATITNATIQAGPGGLFRTTVTTSISNSTIVGDFTLASGQRLTFGRGVELQGDLTLGAPRVAAQTQLYVENRVTLNAPIRLAGLEGELVGLGNRHTLGPDVVLTGTSGKLTGPWTSEGVISMGDATNPVGVLEFSGPIVELTPSSRTVIDIAGPADDQFDRFEAVSFPGDPIIAVIELDGALHVEFVDGYTPDPRDRFEIVRATVVDGTFASTTIEPVGGAGGVGAVGPAHIVYTGETVLVVVCAADRDADGELTIFDFLVFQNQFDDGDPRADLDGDGSLTLFDFLAFQNRFDAGC